MTDLPEPAAVVPAPGTPPAGIEVDDLSVLLFTGAATVRPVNHVSFRVEPGRTMAIVGESGSGKTVTNLAPLGLLPAGVSARVTGRLWVGGREVDMADEAGLRLLRGREVGVIFQDPLSALNPNRRIGPQIGDVLRVRLGLPARAARARAAELLTMVGIPDAAARLRAYPHEMSGGMRQRVMIALALAAEPRVLIADEPTTALDVTVQAQIIELLKALQARLGTAIILITHDIGVVAGMADHVSVMYAGSIVETGPVDDVLTRPAHPYTQALLRSVPDPETPIGSDFVGLPGLTPELTAPFDACPFAPRCERAEPRCLRILPRLAPLPGQPARQAACLVTNPHSGGA